MSSFSLSAVQITSISDVDCLTEDIPMDALHVLTENVTPIEMRLWDNSPIYRRLLLIKYFLRMSSVADAQFKQHRETHLQGTRSPEGPPLHHLYAFKTAFAAINRDNDDCFAHGAVRYFLDLGCSPGGFSTWLIENNNGVRGTGITLPDREASFPVQIDPMLMSQVHYDIRYEDVTDIARRAVTTNSHPIINITNLNLVREEAPDHTPLTHLFDLVVANAYPTLKGYTSNYTRIRLALSQVFIAISNLAPGGSYVMSINTKASLWIVDLLGFLRLVFAEVAAHKGSKLHAIRSSCYLVCRGFRASADDVNHFAAKIRHVLRYLETVAQAASATSDSDSHEDTLPTVTDWNDVPTLTEGSPVEIFDREFHFVLDHFSPIWDVQYNAIRARFAKILSPSTSTGGQAGAADDATHTAAWRRTTPFPTISHFPATSGAGGRRMRYRCCSAAAPQPTDIDAPFFNRKRETESTSWRRPSN